MFEAGIEAALDGITTIEELVRSVRAEAWSPVPEFRYLAITQAG